MLFIFIASTLIYFSKFTGNKRKSSGVDAGPPSKQQKTIYPAYFIPELAHVVAMCDEKMPFMAMAEELVKRGIPHSGLQIEANASSLVLKILLLPEPETMNTTPADHAKVIESIQPNGHIDHRPQM